MARSDRLNRTRSSPRGRRVELMLDPLMDIVACAVGLMLLVVIYSVMELKTSRIRLVAPMLIEAPEGKDRFFYICKKNRIKAFPFDQDMSRIREAHRDNVGNEWFTFRRSESSRIAGTYLGEVVVEETNGLPGESWAELTRPGSVCNTTLRTLDADDAWVCLLVASDSIQVFRKFRGLLQRRGYTTGWDPLVLDFPYVVRSPVSHSSGRRGLGLGPQ